VTALAGGMGSSRGWLSLCNEVVEAGVSKCRKGVTPLVGGTVVTFVRLFAVLGYTMPRLGDPRLHSLYQAFLATLDWGFDMGLIDTAFGKVDFSPLRRLGPAATFEEEVRIPRTHHGDNRASSDGT
jgi:hypothetical protein